MTVTKHDDGEIAIEGDQSNPDSQGFLCVKGKATHEIVGNAQRLLTPRMRDTRGSDDWSDVSWESAMDHIAAKMQAVGRESVGFWQAHGNWGNDYAFGLKRAQMDRFANLYGCQYWNPAMICWGLGGFGVGLTGALETSTKEDLGANAEMVILWGANTVSQASTLKHVQIAKRRGARIVVVDVRRTEASAQADDVVLVKPGTDAAMALAMMQVIIAEELWDRDFVAAHTVGFEALRAHVETMTPDWAETLTGGSAGQIRQLARDYAATKPAMIVIGGSSLHKGSNTWQAARAISCLPALTGNFGRPGGGIGPRHGGRSHGAGFNDVSAADRRLPGNYVPNQMEAIVEALESGAVKVFVTIGSNVLSGFADTSRVRAALANAELIVAYDIFPNQTIREVADIILPGTIWLEEIGAKSTNGFVHLSDKVLPAAGQPRPVYELYRGLALRLSVENVYPWSTQEDAMNAVLDHPATGHATVDTLRANGGRVPLQISQVAYPTRAFSTPSGKIEFYSDRAVSMGLPPLPEPPALEKASGLILAHGRTFARFHSFYDHGQALPSLAKGETEPDLWIAPEDAEALSIADGDRIEISNAAGTFEARAKVTPRMPAGAVWMRDGWPGFNFLTDGTSVLPETALDAFPFSVGQNNYGARVEVRSAKLES